MFVNVQGGCHVPGAARAERQRLDEAVSFYAKLFGAEPAKRRPGYANFAIAEPPLKLVLLENPGQGGSLNHLGVEVPDTAAVDAEQARLAEAGLAPVDERDTTCCYARQDKFWVQGAPNGERWEIYTVLEDSPTFCGEDGGQSWRTGKPHWTLARPGKPRSAAVGSRPAIRHRLGFGAHDRTRRWLTYSCGGGCWPSCWAARSWPRW